MKNSELGSRWLAGRLHYGLESKQDLMIIRAFNATKIQKWIFFSNKVNMNVHCSVHSFEAQQGILTQNQGNHITMAKTDYIIPQK